ncbi:hypothetical protein, partial [Ruminococcus flavefaciens]|uniref:hypothetical protein n=1 Tax=Ruminococcus flavefaciens TaxID=1265 RepID=UPI000474C423
MENETAIIAWMSGWREANAVSADAALTEGQAKAFLSDLKANFSFQTETNANTLIISANNDAEYIAGITKNFENGTFFVLNDAEEIRLINSDGFKTALSSAVGEEWFEIIYNGTLADETRTGMAFEGAPAIRDFVYSGLIMNSTATEIVTVASPADNDHIFGSTLLSVVFSNENITKINGIEKNSLLEMSAFSIQYLGYTTEKAIELLVQYVDFISTGYTDNCLYTVGSNETSAEFWERVYGSGLLENYRTLIEFKSDVDTLRSDAIYFLGEYGNSIDADSIAKLTGIIGCDFDTAMDKYHALQRLYPNGYEYRSAYIDLCIDVILGNISPSGDTILPVEPDPGTGDNNILPVEPEPEPGDNNILPVEPEPDP